MKRRTIIIIVVALVILIAGGIGLYFYLNQQEVVSEEGVVTPVRGTEDIRVRLTEQDIADGKTIEQKEQELQAQQGENRSGFEDVSEVTVRKILDIPASFATLSAAKDRILFYDERLDEFYQVELDGNNSEQITSGGFQDLFNVKWSLSKDAAILSFSSDEGVNERLFTFSFSDQSFNDLGDRVVEAAISPNGNQIVYLFVNDDEDISNISMAELDGSKWKVLQPFHRDNAVLDWTNPFRFLISEEPTSYKSTVLKSLGVTGDDGRTLVADGFGVSYVVSPNGQNVLYTVGSSRSNELFLYATDIEGNFHKDLEISTLAEKCAFAEDNITVYCGVPQRGNLDFVLPDDYLEGRMVTDDSFYRINIETGSKERLAGAAELGTIYDVYKPFISPSGRTMYFTRKQDGHMYALITP